MPAKRVATASPSPSSPEDSTGSPTSTASPPKASPKKTTTKRSPAKRASDADAPAATPTKKAKKAVASTPPAEGSGTTNWAAVPGLTPEKKEAIVHRLFTHAVSDIGTKALAEEFGLDAMAIRNAFKHGRSGNIRDKAVKGVKA